MGAFLLCRNKIIPYSQEGINFFATSGYKEAVRKDFGSYTLYLFHKKLRKSNNYFETDEASIYGTGTFIYRGLSLSSTLQYLLSDFIGGTYDNSRLIGHYYIFIICKGKISILNDGTSLIAAYHDIDGTFLTSSFRAASSISGKLTICKATITENLVTGGITGSDTLFNELKRFSRKTTRIFADIEFCFPHFKQSSGLIKNRLNALEFQAETLNNYIRDCKPMADELGVDTGLTGGFDSRLLLGCIKNQFNNFQVHSHYRTRHSIEWEIARSIAKSHNISFVSPVVRSFSSFSEDELSGILESSFNFYDAQIRMHCNWNEEYNTLEYRLSVLNGKSLGFHGIGGEQYRNADRLYLKSWNFNNWVKYKLVRRGAGNVFKDQKNETAVIEKIKSVINEQLDYSIRDNRIRLEDLKRINNEVFIPSLRGARTNAENAISYFLSPFADFQVSTTAYQVVPFLDCTNNFEIDLIKMISPELSSFLTNYGYSLDKREPFRKYFLITMFENFIPSAANWYLRDKLKNKSKDPIISNSILTFPIIKKCIQNVQDQDLSVDIDSLLKGMDTAPIVLSMGYFLEKFKNRLS